MNILDSTCSTSVIQAYSNWHTCFTAQNCLLALFLQLFVFSRRRLNVNDIKALLLMMHLVTDCPGTHLCTCRWLKCQGRSSRSDGSQPGKRLMKDVETWPNAGEIFITAGGSASLACKCQTHVWEEAKKKKLGQVWNSNTTLDRCTWSHFLPFSFFTGAFRGKRCDLSWQCVEIMSRTDLIHF